MPFEDQLGDAMRSTGDGFVPEDRRALLDGALMSGRRRLARRRAATVTGSVVALAAVGLGGAWASGLVGGSSGGSGGSGGPAASVAAPPKSTLPERVSVTAEQMIKNLISLLPPGKTSVERGSGAGQTGDKFTSPSASVVFDDGKGKGSIGISLSTIDPAGEGATGYVTCPSKAITDYDHCAAEVLPDGSRFMLFQGYEYPDRREETKNWRATLVTPKGVLVDASEYNAAAEKGAKISRVDPPLTGAQMKALVSAEVWKTTMAGAKVPRSESVPRSEPSGASMQRELVASLPKALKVVDQGNQGGYAFAVVDDGKGKSLVGINVQPGMGDVPLQGAVSTLPNGTRVGEEQRPGEKGGAGVVWWTVDTIRKNDLRVVISAFNTGNQNAPATRATPALTMAQLKGIALDPKWDTLS
ncbi:hypothetical protein [Streptomyces melanogenes]|uniref:Uncharacterized protein n=1 Tax=Streptomyces melanogenes TaxID=67326 RepID=A0ABZ1XM10_9ACTN|nr:hypothetical protein [Streptomyces melanogenes]